MHKVRAVLRTRWIFEPFAFFQYMANEREVEFHLRETGDVEEFRDMEKLGRELLFDSCQKGSKRAW